MKTITEVINDTLRELHTMKESNNDSSFCFPRYANGNLRISEQELRICLIKNLYQAIKGYLLKHPQNMHIVSRVE